MLLNGWDDEMYHYIVKKMIYNEPRLCCMTQSDSRQEGRAENLELQLHSDTKGIVEAAADTLWEQVSATGRAQPHSDNIISTW